MKLSNGSARSTEEWIGKHPDQAIPPYVRLRVFNRYQGRCYRSKKTIRPGDAWDIEHVIALCNGGEHRESNMAPIFHGKVHQQKTAEDREQKAKTDSIRKKHFGISGQKRKICYRRFDGTPVDPNRRGA